MLEQAIEIAKTIDRQEHRLVAIVTDKKDRILSIGINSYVKSHPTQAYFAKKAGKKKAIYLHAEIDALIKCKRFKPHKIFVARVNRKGESRLAAPCRICQLAIRDMGISEICYTKGE